MRDTHRFGVISLSLVCPLVGCVSPPEVKQASQTQLELINTLDAAVGDLQLALVRFHSENEALIREEGRMTVAKEAITNAFGDSKDPKPAVTDSKDSKPAVTDSKDSKPAVTDSKDSKALSLTPDELLENHGAKIRTWIDHALELYQLEEQKGELEEKIKNTKDSDEKDILQLKLNAVVAKIVKVVKKINAVGAKIAVSGKLPEWLASTVEDFAVPLKAERDIAKAVHDDLEIVRAQLAVMRFMAKKVDAWLSIDVTVSAEQIDGLKDAYEKAYKDMKGGGQ